MKVKINFNMKKALIVVDMQNDFCKGGSLEVTDSESIVPYINCLMENKKYDEVVFTQDFHPKEHKSFASNQGKNVGEIICLNGISQVLWADHCIQGTFGAEIYSEIDKKYATKFIQKGMNPDIDSYSAFFDNQHLADTGLADYLRNRGIKELEVVGLALDYCVKYTCLDAVKMGFKTALHFKGTRAVNLNPDDAKNTIFELLESGISILG